MAVVMQCGWLIAELMCSSILEGILNFQGWLILKCCINRNDHLIIANMLSITIAS